MLLSSFVIKLLAKQAHRKSTRDQKNAIADQDAVLKKIISSGKKSTFLKDLKISSPENYTNFRDHVPISNYENYRNYIKLLSRGEQGVLTFDSPKYFAITSGTTSGTKYIPLTQKMWKFQSQAIKELLLLYAYQKGDYNFSNAGMMFIQGSPELNYFGKIPFGKLSGIAARHVPFFLKKNRFPSMRTNCLSPWDKKIEKIVEETWNKNMQIIGGIPPWVITYLEALLKYTKKQTAREVFKNLKLYIHGGTSFETYRSPFLKLCGNVDTLEVYPASEGFFGYQNTLSSRGLLLLTNHGVFYEFILVSNFKKGVMDRVPLEGVVLNVDYVMIVSTVAGLWAYNIGDTVCFISKNPYKFVFSGRASQYCSAFGEHVIEKEVQEALSKSLSKFGGTISEFSVCPRVGSVSGESFHEWFVEFVVEPSCTVKFAKYLNDCMKSQNIYYKDLVSSGVIKKLKLYCVHSGGFNAYMKSIGKFGGQNKCPHLSNKRDIGDFLLKGGYVKK
tara:strand:+ start:521 stop:2023 length:1503 start_codon:yes stop_codon:yes gene_type:complete